MAITYTNATSATLHGAVQFNRIHRVAAESDAGFMLERLVSSVNDLQSAVSQINIALGSGASTIGGASLFSAFSAYGNSASPGAVSAQSSISNFRASWTG